MHFPEIKQMEEQYLMQTYGRSQVAFDHGQGAKMWDTEGKEYIDLTAGIGVNCLGHNNPKLVAAITEQAGKLLHVCNLYYTEPLVKAAKLLCEASGMKRAFFGNSGAEANEGAIKLARKYSFDKYGKGRQKIVTLVNSFHGRTIVTLEATGQDKFHNYFFPFTEGFDYAEANNLEDLKAKCDDTVCAVMMELIQGESGVMPLDEAFVKGAEAFCKERDILFIVDEVQTGVARSGAFYSFQKFGVKPDIVTSAKGLAGGVPIGAVLAGEKCENVFKKGDHGTTFGGNALATAAACAVIEEVNKPEFLKSVEEKGEYLKKAIMGIGSPKVKAVRGMGLMLGVQLADPSERADLCAKLLQGGVVVLTAGTDVIRLLPPLVITKEEIDQAVGVMKEVLA